MFTLDSITTTVLQRAYIAMVFFLAICNTTVQAADLLTLSITQNGQTFTRSFNSVDEVSAIARDNPDALFPGFDTSQPASANVDYFGQEIIVSSSSFENGAQDATLTIPSLGITQAFTASGDSADAVRSAGLAQIQEFIESDSNNVLQRLQQVVVENSPNSIIAGNPNSIQTKTVMADFDTGFTRQISRIGRASKDNAPNLFGVNPTYDRFNQGGVKTSSLTLPLSYTFRSKEDAQRQLILSAPLSYGTIGSSKAYAGSLATSAVFPILPNWRITPGVGYSLAGSDDLGQVAQQVGASVTSAYEWGLPNNMGTFAMGNMIGHYQTFKLKLRDTSFDPGIKNTVLRNGFMYIRPIHILDETQKLSLELGYANTRFNGSKTNTRNQNELSIAIGNQLGDGPDDDSALRAGLTYIKSKDSNGVRMMLGYWF